MRQRKATKKAGTEKQRNLIGIGVRPDSSGPRLNVKHADDIGDLSYIPTSV